MAKAENDIIVCRCEDVTLGEIRKAIKEGATTIDEVKRITRWDGPMPGIELAGYWLQVRLPGIWGKPVSEILQSRYRPPVKPVKMGDLASITGEDEKGTGRNFDCKRQEEVTE